MSKKWPYVVVALGSFAFGGMTCSPAGYLLGYYYRGQEVLVQDLNDDGNDDLCVLMNENEAKCAIDYNLDGAGDIVEVDLAKGEFKKISLGRNPCLVKSIEDLMKSR